MSDEHKPATFEDYKKRLYSGDPDLWFMRWPDYFRGWPLPGRGTLLRHQVEHKPPHNPETDWSL